MPQQAKLPEKYSQMSPEQLGQAVAAHKQAMGKSLCILGHHYQRDPVIQYADFTGDSLKLSRLAAEQKDARWIVFCGVHFMAESADILSGPQQVVILPNLLAGCTMAEMADEASVESALTELSELTDDRIVPITYVNSTAEVKAVTARARGACCTSSNVRGVFEWALRSESAGGAGAGKILAVPDQHLGRNTAVAMGYALDECCVYDPLLPHGGLNADDVRRAKFILWAGHCYVHQLFTPADVEAVRRRHEDIQVIVHPECPYEVVRLADAAGSTSQIISAVAAAVPDSKWAIGTESNLVNRLARQHHEKFIRVLSDRPAMCQQMGRIGLPHLLWVLDNLAEGRVVNQIKVDKATADNARAALQRMIDIRPTDQVTPKH